MPMTKLFASASKSQRACNWLDLAYLQSARIDWSARKLVLRSSEAKELARASRAAELGSQRDHFAAQPFVCKYL